MFADAFDPAFRRDLYPLFEQVQERLGAINDHAAAQMWFEHCAEQDECLGAQAQLKDLAAHEAEQIDEAGEEFQRWWNDDIGQRLKE